MSRKLLLKEAYDSFRYLMDHTNYNENSTGYGLTLDRHLKESMSSVCASGFTLSALVIGVERKWLDYEIAKKKSISNIKKFLP